MSNDNNFSHLINLGSYKPKFFIFRIFIISLVAIVLINISSKFSPEENLTLERKLLVHLIAIVAFNSVSEFNLLAMRLINRWERIRWNLYVRGVIVLAISVVLIFFWIWVAEKILSEEKILEHPGTQITLIIGFLIIVIHLLFIIISNLTQEWLNNRKEISELKQAKLISDYNLLKDRLNPHFLFNNLSVLKSLIHYSPDDAEKFTQNFTNVYRYVLKSHEEKTVSLREEIKFLESYIALHKERIGEGLNVTISINDSFLEKRLPPLTLQLLLENAIKHNTANKNKPLSINILSDGEIVEVKNNMHKKETTYSTHTGLKTLQGQYKLLVDQDIIIDEDEEFFVVKVPLL